MPHTTPHGLPLIEDTNGIDIPRDLGTLSNDLDTILYNQQPAVWISTRTGADVIKPPGQQAAEYLNLKIPDASPGLYWIIGHAIVRIQVRRAVNLYIQSSHKRLAETRIGMNYHTDEADRPWFASQMVFATYAHTTTGDMDIALHTDVPTIHSNQNRRVMTFPGSRLCIVKLGGN